MKILMISRFIDPKGGVATYLMTVIRELLRRGNEIILIYMWRIDEKDRRFYEEMGVRLYYIPSLNGESSKFQSEVLDKFLRKEQPDVAIVHSQIIKRAVQKLKQNMKVIRFFHEHMGYCLTGDYLLRYPKLRVCEKPVDFRCYVNLFTARCYACKMVLHSGRYRNIKRMKESLRLYNNNIVVSNFMKRNLLRNGVSPDKISVITFSRGLRMISRKLNLMTGRCCSSAELPRRKA